MGISDFRGQAGSNWDFLNFNGALTINATYDSQYLINLVSLLVNSIGRAANFDLYSNYSFAIATAVQGIPYQDGGSFSAPSGSCWT